MPKKKEKNILKLVALALFAGVTIFLIFKLSPATAPTPPERIEFIAPAVIDSSVLGRKDFKDLRGFGQYPVRPGTLGRENPFAKPSKEEILKGISGGAGQ